MKHFFAVAVAAASAGVASAQISASGTYSFTPNGSNYDYSIHLVNTGTTTIDAFWFAWFPDYNLMLQTPTSVSSPAGWTSGVTTDFFQWYGIEWQTSTAPIAIGGSLDFNFTSPVTPAAMAGTNAYWNLPTTYSYVYQGAPYPGTSPFYVINHLNAVPEPASLALLSGSLLLIRRKKVK